MNTEVRVNKKLADYFGDMNLHKARRIVTPHLYEITCHIDITDRRSETCSDKSHEKTEFQSLSAHECCQSHP
jgi:hypothetical protein